MSRKTQEPSATQRRRRPCRSRSWEACASEGSRRARLELLQRKNILESARSSSAKVDPIIASLALIELGKSSFCFTALRISAKVAMMARTAGTTANAMKLLR